MKYTILPVFLFSFSFLALFGWGKQNDVIKAEEIVLADSLKEVSLCYETHVKPLIERSCAPCHTAHSAGGASLKDLAATIKNMDESIALIIKGKMPKGDKPKVSGAEVAVLKAWKEKGGKSCEQQ